MGKYREVTSELLKLVQQRKTGKEISSILNLDYSTVHKKLRKLGINLHNYHNELKFNNKVFDSIDTEEKAYWLGFLYADGSVSARDNQVELSLASVDREHLQKFKEFLESKNEVKLSNSRCNGKIYQRCRFNATDKHFHDRLVELGCIPRKSLILKFPDKSIFKNTELIKDFIRGYIDGDGCLTYTKTGRLVIEVIGTKEFLDGIINYFPQFFAGKTAKKDKRNTNNTCSISCSCDKADKLATVLYEDAAIYLDRKYNRFAVLRRNS